MARSHPLESIGLQLSEEKTRITHWNKPITFLGYHIHGEPRINGVQIRAILTIPKEKERLIRRELLKTSSYQHIPEPDAMLNMSAKYRGWCNYYKYASNPQVVFSRLSQKMWWFFAHFLARNRRSNIKNLLIWAKTTGKCKEISKGNNRRLTFTIKNGKREMYLDLFPPKTAEIRAVSNKETWTVDLKPVNPLNWMQGRSAATKLTALARSEGICERCGENPAEHVHHKNRMKSKRTMLAKTTSDRDQREQAQALCKECHLEVHHGNFGLDHGVGHPVPSDLPRGSPRRTEGRWRELDRCQNRGKHTTRFLPEKPLRRCRPVRTREEKVLHRCQARTLSGVVESSKLVMPQREVPVAPFHRRTRALEHLRELRRGDLQRVGLNRAQLPQRPAGLKQWWTEALGTFPKRLACCHRPSCGHTLARV